MVHSSDNRVLAFNIGSSSLKAALYQMNEKESLVLSLNVIRIGLRRSRMRIADADGTALFDGRSDMSDHEAALKAMFAWFEQHNLDQQIHCVGHRIVHGGDRYSEPQLVTPELMA